MKKFIVIFVLILCSKNFAQYEIGAGMGISLFNASDLRDYLNSNFASTQISSFSTSADFFSEFNFNITSKYQLSIEYDYNIYSYNSTLGGYEFKLNQHKPSFLAYYYLAGDGYKFKIGGGLGLRIAQAEEKLYGSFQNYSTTGFGFIAKVQGDTKLGGDFYALIAGEIIYDLPGEITTANNIDGNGKFNLNSFAIGLKLGIIYYF
jgi:hypothetical protein